MRSGERIREVRGKKTNPEEERQELKRKGGGGVGRKLIKKWNGNKDERREEKGKER